MQRREASLLLVDNHRISTAIWRVLLGVSIQSARNIPEAMRHIQSSPTTFHAMMIHDWVGGGSLAACCNTFKRATKGGGIILISNNAQMYPRGIYDEIQGYPYNWPVLLAAIRRLCVDVDGDARSTSHLCHDRR